MWFVDQSLILLSLLKTPENVTQPSLPSIHTLLDIIHLFLEKSFTTALHHYWQDHSDSCPERPRLLVWFLSTVCHVKPALLPQPCRFVLYMWWMRQPLPPSSLCIVPFNKRLLHSVNNLIHQQMIIQEQIKRKHLYLIFHAIIISLSSDLACYIGDLGSLREFTLLMHLCSR